ncbi:DUF6602 domain-containing protein [Micromonospora aurantiaca (nom. illeg.)]|uniref:DUF6602 domain-containing protein n=1 Tax=Micromonospora aurantiaca (nom. illeg.) TaxID=47850 RepID=UPI0001DF70D1|nr:DUF6602 domain-containing protein [Micromonospora aurantiaca]ADL46093.1 hypothetical protein Micau_2554 [Micromonospora aurantiaca ATCC 27029]
MTNPHRPHELDTWIEQTTSEMASEYERIRLRATEDPGTAGDEGEENWARLLREWLPSSYQVRTKGRILAHDGAASRQVDVVVLRPGYPSKLLDKKLYVTSGVAAAFECKLTLTAAHIKEATQTAAEIARMAAPRQGTPYKELVSPIVYGVLAHAHGWSSDHVAVEKINEYVVTGTGQHALHAREFLDLVCVANTCVTLKSTRLTHMAAASWHKLGGDPSEVPEPLHCFVGSFLPDTSRPAVGSLLAYLLIRLGWEDPQVRPFADYFRLAKIFSRQFGGEAPVRPTGLTPETEAAVLSAPLNENPDAPWPWSWDEWGFSLE